MTRDREDDEYQPSRQRPANRSSVVERKIINPRAINTYRTLVMFAIVWDSVIVALLMTGIWTIRRGDTSDVWVMSATFFVSVVGIVFAWLFPSGDND